MKKLVILVISVGYFFATALFAGNYTISIEEAQGKVGQKNVQFVFSDAIKYFEKNHIPGSAHAFTRDLHLLSDIIKCQGLPMCPETAGKFIGSLGISNDTEVIVYDDGRGANASGVWFFLTLYGHKNVKILEGGLLSWEEKALKVESGKGHAPTGKPFTVELHTNMLASRNEVKKAIADPSNFVLLDARHKFAEYTGKSLGLALQEPGKEITVARGGFIPTAIFSPWTKYAGNKAGKANKPIFKTSKNLKKQLDKLKKNGYADTKTVISYCHVGLGRGTFQYLALALAGHDISKIKVYVGSWNEWGNDKTLPLGKI